MDETASISISNKWGMGGGFLTLMYGWLSDANTAVFIGVIVTIVGFVMSLYFQRRRHYREKGEAELRIKLALKEDERKEELHKIQIQEYTNKMNGRTNG